MEGTTRSRQVQNQSRFYHTFQHWQNKVISKNAETLDNNNMTSKLMDVYRILNANNFNTETKHIMKTSQISKDWNHTESILWSNEITLEIKSKKIIRKSYMTGN